MGGEANECLGRDEKFVEDQVEPQKLRRPGKFVLRSKIFVGMSEKESVQTLRTLSTERPKDASKKRKFLLCMCPCYVDTYIEFVCTNIHSTALLISYFLTVRKCGIFCRLHLGSASCVSLTHLASSGERNFFLNENYKLRHDILRAESSEFFIYPVWKLFSPPLRTDFFSFCHIHDEKKCANAGNKK